MRTGGGARELYTAWPSCLLLLRCAEVNFFFLTWCYCCDASSPLYPCFNCLFDTTSVQALIDTRVYARIFILEYIFGLVSPHAHSPPPQNSFPICSDAFLNRVVRNSPLYLYGSLRGRVSTCIWLYISWLFFCTFALFLFCCWACSCWLLLYVMIFFLSLSLYVKMN